MTIALILIAWTLLSVPFGMFVGKCIGYCDQQSRVPAEEFHPVLGPGWRN